MSEPFRAGGDSARMDDSASALSAARGAPKHAPVAADGAPPAPLAACPALDPHHQPFSGHLMLLDIESVPSNPLLPADASPPASPTGAECSPQRASPRQPQAGGEEGGSEAHADSADRAERTLFFARASSIASTEEITAAFATCGPVSEVNLFRAWPTAKVSKGCGLVVMATPAAAAAAIAALDKKMTWDGADGPMVVERCDPARLGAKAAAAAACKAGRAAAAAAAAAARRAPQRATAAAAPPAPARRPPPAPGGRIAPVFCMPVFADDAGGLRHYSEPLAELRRDALSAQRAAAAAADMSAPLALCAGGAGGGGGGGAGGGYYPSSASLREMLARPPGGAHGALEYVPLGMPVVAATQPLVVVPDPIMWGQISPTQPQLSLSNSHSGPVMHIGDANMPVAAATVHQQMQQQQMQQAQMQQAQQQQLMLQQAQQVRLQQAQMQQQQLELQQAQQQQQQQQQRQQQQAQLQLLMLQQQQAAPALPMAPPQPRAAFPMPPAPPAPAAPPPRAAPPPLGGGRGRQQMMVPIAEGDMAAIAAHVPTLELLTGAALSIEAGTIEGPQLGLAPQQQLFLVISGTPPQLQSASTLLARLRAADGAGSSAGSNSSFAGAM
ncbi:MAG: hypothetical protein J3K34DRAFT_522143 [Monoraphidium minutum]|nr:MAG: hypothetical protein J3K34DRAFT_522143 [Monoraphidium minutum]